MNLTWDHALYVIVAGAVAGFLEVRRRRDQRPISDQLRAIYGYLNGSGIMGKLKGIEE